MQQKQKITLTGFSSNHADLLELSSFSNLRNGMEFPYEATIVETFIEAERTEYIVLTSFGQYNLMFFDYNPKEFIDFQPLCERLDTLLGVEGTYILWDQKKPTIKTPAFEIGVFHQAICKCEIGFFNFRFDEKKKTLWGDVDLFYESYEGGTNGMKILNVWYNYNTSGWTFETEIERVKKYRRD